MSAAYGPPAAQRRRRGGIVGPLVLIFVGCVFLLENTGYLPHNAWLSLWRLWPLVLVLVGVELLLANRVPWLVLASLAVIVLTAGVVATTSGLSPRGTPSAGTLARSTQTDLGGATQATITVRFGAGQLNIGPIVGAGTDQLAVLMYDGPPDLAPEARYSVGGSTGRLEYQIGSHAGPGFIPWGDNSNAMRMDLNLSPKVPITTLNVQTGATDAHLDLTSLNVSNLEMSVGAASTWIRLPEAAGTTTVHVSGGASTITLEIPQGVAAQIRHRGGLSTFEIDQTRFPSVGDGVYQSADYANATNKVNLNLETGVTSIQIN